MSQAFAQQLGLKIRKTNVRAQKIDGTTLETYGMVVSTFSVSDKDGKERSFEESFLLAVVRLDIVLGMPFLTMSNADVDFQAQNLQWRSYTIRDILPTTRRVELIRKKEYATAALDPEHETFVVHVAALSVDSGVEVHPSRRAQIAYLKADEAPTKVPCEYIDFSDIFLPKLAAELPEHTGINDHAIELVDDWQPPYGPIYSLGTVELEILKAYIENNLASDFIWPFKSPAGAPILFDKKPDSSLRLCVDYRGLNNLTIKNWYPLPLVGESFDRLGRALRFTQLNLTNAYYRMRIRERDEWKMAFRTRYGHFEYQVMPFGLTNAPATFQGYINKILAEKLDLLVIIYLDDILIYIENEGEEHVQTVQWVLDQLRNHSLYANLKKCHFHQDEVKFLGFNVSHQGIQMEEERIKAIRDCPEPQSVRDIQVFLGFANFYQRFIQGFSRLAASLTSMLKTTSATGPTENPEQGGQEIQVEDQGKKEPV